MIAKLTGRVERFLDDGVIFDVRGVGYRVYISGRTRESLLKSGEEHSLFIETVFRADLLRLYGFSRTDEQEWFQQLVEVRGVGARIALAILSVLSPEELGKVILFDDAKKLTQAPGVGAKVARRIIGELREKVPDSLRSDGSGAMPVGLVGAGEPSAEALSVIDARSALVNLGYGEAAAAEAVMAASGAMEGATDTSALIRLALRHLSGQARRG